MSKWYGKIGFADMQETVPGVYTPVITEKAYRGEMYKSSRLLQASNLVNDNINVSNQLSIVADPYLDGHIHDMLYVVFKGAKWKVTPVDLSQRPRLTLTLGGLYNEH